MKMVPSISGTALMAYNFSSFRQSFNHLINYFTVTVIMPTAEDKVINTFIKLTVLPVQQYRNQDVHGFYY